MRARTLSFAAAFLSLPPPAIAAAAGENGRAIEVHVTAAHGAPLQAGQAAEVRVRVRDPASGFPLTGLVPALWIVRDDGEGERGCQRWVNWLRASAIPPEGTVDLNGFDVVEATVDGRLALVDPLLNIASANIKAIVDLGAPPVGWAIDAAGSRLAVGTQADRSLHLIDMQSFRVQRTLRLTAAATALEQVGDLLWLGLEDGSVVSVAGDVALGQPAALGDGPVALAPAGDTRILAVAASGDGAYLSGGGPPRTFKLPVRAAQVRYSALADSGFIAAADGSALFVVPQDDPTAWRKVPLERPATAMAADPGGRWIAMTASDRRAVIIVDTGSGTAKWTIALDDPVIAAEFSDAFLYLMHERQGGVSRVVFDPAGGPPSLVTIAAGSVSEALQKAGRLPMLSRIPGKGMLVASSRDNSAYMVSDDNAQAAMSNLPLRAGTPAGILLRYRGLSAAAERGEYRTAFVPPAGGDYIALVRTEQPAIAHCARLSILRAPGELAQVSTKRVATIARALAVDEMPGPGRQRLAFSIRGGAPVRLLAATLVGEGWQAAPPDIRTTEGGYVMDVDLPAGRGIVLFVRYRDDSGDHVLTAPIVVATERRPL